MTDSGTCCIEKAYLAAARATPSRRRPRPGRHMCVCGKVPSVSPSQKNFAYHAEVTKSKPWTAGINSHQQITDWSLALFPEICNTSHMGTKCVPDVRGSCVVRPVCTLRSVLGHQKILLSLVSTSLHGRTLGCFFLRLSINFSSEDAGTAGGLFSLTLADSSAVLIRYCFQKIKAPCPAGGLLRRSTESWFLCVINGVHNAGWSNAAIPPSALVAFSGSNGEAESQQLKC